MSIRRTYAERDPVEGRTYQVHTVLICPHCQDRFESTFPSFAAGASIVNANGDVGVLFTEPLYTPPCGHEPVKRFIILTTHIGDGYWPDLFRGVLAVLENYGRAASPDADGS